MDEGDKMKDYEIFQKDAASAFDRLARRYKPYADMRRVLSASAEVTFEARTITYTASEEELKRVEEAIPYLDQALRECSGFIEDVEELVPVEFARHITTRSIRHLARHTELIREVRGNRVIPSKVLNVDRDETYLTYENKFLNSLLLLLGDWVNRYLTVLRTHTRTEREYRIRYQNRERRFGAGWRGGAEFSATAIVPAEDAMDTGDFSDLIARLENLSDVVQEYRRSRFAKALGKNQIRPPVVRTNALLKNKNLNACLALWEILSCHRGEFLSAKAGDFVIIPSETFSRNCTSSAALHLLELCKAVEREINDSTQ